MLDPMTGVVAASLLGVDVGGAWHRWSPVVSLGLAAAALWFTWANRRTSKKALALSVAQEDRRSARLNLSFEQATNERSSASAGRLISIKILAVNPTDRDGTLVQADLHVTYRPTLNDPLVVKIAHDPALRSSSPDHTDLLRLPIRLQANGAISGWLTFVVADEVTNGSPIERFDLVVHDSRGVDARIEPWVMKEILSEAAKTEIP